MRKPLVITLVVVVLLALAGFGGWKAYQYLYQRFTPEQREHFLSGFSGCGVSVVIGPDAAARATGTPMRLSSQPHQVKLHAHQEARDERTRHHQ